MDFIEKDTICNIELVKLKHLPTIKLGSYIYAYSNSDISFNICDYNGNLLYEDCLGVSKFGNYIILRNKDNLYGVLNEEGKLIVDFKYESIDYINNCSMFIYKQENYCYLVNENQEFVYKSSIINHIGDDLFICNNDKETFIIDNFGNKVVNLKKKSFLKNFSSKYKKYIIDNSIKKKVLNRTGKLIYKSKDYFVFLDENRILVHSNNKIKIHDLSKSKTFNIPNYYAYKDYCTNYVILKDKHNKTDCILNNNKYVYISSSKIKKVKITYIYNDLIYGTYEEDDVVKAFVSDINGRVIVKDVDQEYIVEDYILVVKDKKYGVLNLNGDILLNIEYDNIKYANGLFYVKSKDKFYVYNSDMKIIYSNENEIEYVDSNNKFLVVLSNHRNILLTLNGDILISGIDDNIILINENKVIVGNSVVNLDSEYFNSAIDYQLIVNINNKAYLFHNDSKKKREKLKQGICSDISKIMDEYKLLDDSKKVYRKIDKNGIKHVR